jgi:hypothetical protein
MNKYKTEKRNIEIVFLILIITYIAIDYITN